MAPHAFIALLLLLCAAGGARCARVDDVDPNAPPYQLANLPRDVCPATWSSAGVVPDVRDPTSYFVCCGTEARARATCRYLREPVGVYQSALTPSLYTPSTGQCRDVAAAPTEGSFNTDTSPQLPPALLALYANTTPVATEHAAAVCRGLAAAASPSVQAAAVLRQAAPASVAGEWRTIRSRSGRSSTGVVAIHAALLPGSDEVLLWSRVHKDRNPNYEPGVIGSDGSPEVSTVFNVNDGTYVVKRVRSTPFCSGGTVMPDDSVFAAGGDDMAVPGYQPALQALRLFERRDGSWRRGEWRTLPAQLRDRRWYPSQTLMHDGNRVLVCGGSISERNTTPQPSCEVYDHRTRTIVARSTLAVMQRWQGYIYYPVVFVLPYPSSVTPTTAHVYMFNCDQGAVMRLTGDNKWSEYRTIPASLWPTQGFCASMSMAGTSVLLMLDPATQYAAEVVTFGGFRKQKGQCDCDTPANGYAHRIKLDKATVDGRAFAWQREAMPSPRNLNDGVLMPDGKVLIVNGAQRGVVGNTRSPAYEAWSYNPAAPAGRRFTVMAATTTRRLYHSTALLLPDASVLVVGSEYNECPEGCSRGAPYLYQHAAERFLPPYFASPARPTITAVSGGGRFALTITVTFRGTATHAVLMAPGTVTHQVNMHQRGVRLAVVSRAPGSLTLRLPPNGFVTPPGSHMLFLMNGEVPCTKAAWVRLRA